MSNNVKQVIVIRKDIPMRKGKMVAQGSHASLEAFRKASEVQVQDWDNNGYKKICAGCKDANELSSLYEQALAANLPCSYIIDNGLTEFKEPTATAIAIGPASADDIDKITGKLILL